MRFKLHILAATLLSVMPGCASHAVAHDSLPGPSTAKPLKPSAKARAQLRDHLGEGLDPELRFVDQEGRSVRLGDWFGGQYPVLLTLNSFHRGTFGDEQLARLMLALRANGAPPRDAVRVVSVSIDPRDDTHAAHERWRAFAARDPNATLPWSFLTADAATSAQLARQLGFPYRYDTKTDQYEHAVTTFVLTPTGELSRYFYGLDYARRDLRFMLLDASQGRAGSSADTMLLSCFHYDELTGRYDLSVLGVLRAAGVCALLALFCMFTWLRARTPELAKSTPIPNDARL